MKQVIRFTILISTIIFLFSCGTKSKTNLVTGKWAFDKIEKMSNPDSANADEMNKNSEGIIATFRDDGTFISIRTKDGYSDTLGNGSYEVTSDEKFIVTHDNRTSNTDSVEIIELSSKILKVKTSKKDILILKKVQ
ncbi:MAG TPA: hypothetical protein VKC90_13360 [Chitinophagaceae bacterium]|nr:hypothetical protein [Chitinophagaceae bacterium]